MASPISGDRILPQRDVNPSQPGRKAQAEKAEETQTAASRPVQQDSVELQSTFSESQARPLSETLQDAAQARDKLAELLGAMRDRPEQALAAQGGINQAQADALLSHPG